MPRALLPSVLVLAALAPVAPGSTMSRRDPAYASERGTIGSSINFVVGASLMSGMVRFTARIWLAADATRTPVDRWQETVDATLRQTLSLRGIFVHYTGPDPTINATSTAPVATSRLARTPAVTRESMSRPASSVPIQWLMLGASNRIAVLGAAGS